MRARLTARGENQVSNNTLAVTDALIYAEDGKYEIKAEGEK